MKVPDSGRVDGQACLHRHSDIGRAKVYEQVGRPGRIVNTDAQKESINLYQAAADIVVKTGNFKRNIPLPNILRSYVATGAKFEDGTLCIQFEKGSGEDE